jgi:hypothetical protein
MKGRLTNFSWTGEIPDWQGYDMYKPKKKRLPKQNILPDFPEVQDYDWLWEELVELPNECWIWSGAHTRTGRPIQETAKKRSERDVHRLMWKVTKGSRYCAGTVKPCSRLVGCVNPSHYSIVY